MRIMHVLQPVEAGVPVVSAGIARDQARRGHDVVIVCPPDGLRQGPVAAALAADSAIRGIAWQAARSPGASVPGEARRLAGIVRSEQPDVMFVHSAKAGLAGRLAVRGRIPTVYVPHAWSFEAVTGAMATASTAWERFAARWAQQIVCVSADERLRGEQAGVRADMAVIDQGVDLEHFTPADRAQARQALGLPDVPTVVCLGRLSRQKGQDRLIAAWPSVIEQVPDAELVLVGDGPDAEELRRSAGPSVRFVGASSDPRGYLAAADVVALASRWEGGGLVVLEAMASGRSVVGVDVTGLRHVLGGTGIVVTPDRPDELAAALVSRLRDQQATDADGRSARTVAEARHNLDVSLSEWDRILQKTASVLDVDRSAAGATPAAPHDGSAAAMTNFSSPRAPRSSEPVAPGSPAVAPLRIAATPGALAMITSAGASGPAIDLAALDLVPVTATPVALVRDVRRLDVDVVALSAADPAARWSAAWLRASGVTVWWLGPAPTSMRVPGAALIASASPDADAVAEVAAAAGRPGSAGATPGPALSVVITTLNEGDALERVIAAVGAQLGDKDEMIIVDGGSTDGSVERAVTAWAGEPRVRLTVHPGAGISQGRNIGVRTAVNDVIICTDAGCDPDPSWVDGMRTAFSGVDAPGLVSGTYHVAARSALERAQALACYPDPVEVHRRDAFTALYTAVFGLGFDPRFCVGRCVGFTRAAFDDVGGFPEDLPTGEDVSFGLAVAENHRVVGTTDADVVWHQRDTIGATWRMYRNYGIASGDGGDRRLLVRDAARGLAYLGVLPLLLTGPGRRIVLAGGAAYLSLPVRRALRARVGVDTYPMIPLAMATKDLGKLWGALIGIKRARSR